MNRNIPHAEWSPVTRRQALAGIGTLAVGGTTVLVATDDARAAVSIDSFSVDGAEFTAESVTPELVVSLAYSYDVGNASISGLRFSLSVGETEIASSTLDTTRSTLEETTELRGLVTDAEGYSASDFAPEVASSVSETLAVSVTFAVLDDAGDVLVSDSVSDSAPVSVSHPQESTYQIAVGGEGRIIDASSEQ